MFILPLGIAYESFEVSYSSDSVDSKDTYQIASVFVNLPVPVINIALGAGAGMVTGEDEKKEFARFILGVLAAVANIIFFLWAFLVAKHARKEIKEGVE